jgi:hypothetical protein
MIKKFPVSYKTLSWGGWNQIHTLIPLSSKIYFNILILFSHLGLHLVAGRAQWYSAGLRAG